MQIVKLYLRLIKKIRPLLLFYILAFCLVVYLVYFFEESGYQGVFLIHRRDRGEYMPLMRRVFYGNVSNFQFYMNALSFLLVMTIVSGCGIFMQNMHETGIRYRNQMLPISDRKLKFQLILANFVFALGIDLLFYLVGVILYRYEYVDEKSFFYLVNCLFFSFTMIAVSYLVSFMFKKKVTVIIFSIIYAISNSLMGGFLIPQGYYSKTFRVFAEFTPSYWFVRGNAYITAGENIDFYNSSIAECFYMETFWAIGFLAFALAIEKVRHREKLY